MATVKVKFVPSATEGKEGTLSLQVIHCRMVRRVSTGCHIRPTEWSETRHIIKDSQDPIRNRALALFREKLRHDTERLQRVIASLENRGAPYNVDEILAEFERVTREHSLFYFMERLILQLQQRGKARTSETYRATLNSFKRYRRGEDLPLDALTSDVLLLYEADMKRRGVCPNTTSFYMRILRAVYNKSVEQGLAVQQHPFAHVYTGIDKTIKRALTVADVRCLKELDLTCRPALAYARDMFLFSFYTRGMSFIDMAHLRKSDLQGGVLVYRRRKTGQQLVIKVEPCMAEILERYRAGTSNYLLPIITDEANARRQYRNTLHAVNRCLKVIGAMLNIPVKLTTYVGRHSWATAARQNSIPLSVISESLGHENEQTTQIYLASIDKAVIDEANAKILEALR